MQYSVPPDLDVRESTMLSTSNRSSSSNKQLDDTCIGMADTVIAYVVMAYIVMALYSYGLYSNDCGYGLCIHGLYSYVHIVPVHKYGIPCTCIHGLYS